MSIDNINIFHFLFIPTKQDLYDSFKMVFYTSLAIRVLRVILLNVCTIF